VKEETAVLEGVTEHDTVTTNDRAVFRDNRAVPSPSEDGRTRQTASGDYTVGTRIKGLLLNVGRAIERFMEHDHEFDHR